MSLGEFLGSGSSVSKLILHMNGNSNDSSGNSLNGSDTNITYGKQYGKFNEGALFNGSTSNIQCNNVTINVDGFTIIAWRYILNSSVYRCILSKCNSNQPQPFDIYVSKGSTTINFFVGDGDSATANSILQVSNSVIFNKWQCWMFTFDSSKNMKICVDGKLIGSGVGAGATPVDGTNPIMVGIRQDGATKMYGYADETIIENRVWTFQEYQKYYTNALGRF